MFCPHPSRSWCPGPRTHDVACLEGPFGSLCHSFPYSIAWYSSHHLVCERHLLSKGLSLIFLGPPETFRAARRHSTSQAVEQRLCLSAPQLLPLWTSVPLSSSLVPPFFLPPSLLSSLPAPALSCKYFPLS